MHSMKLSRRHFLSGMTGVGTILPITTTLLKLEARGGPWLLPLKLTRWCERKLRPLPGI